jgi:hypothetical protein
MTKGQKLAAAVVVIGLAVAAGEVLYIHHERVAASAPATEQPEAAVDPDALVFLKKERPSSVADVKQLDGTTLWVSAGGQMEYYPYAAHRADYAHSAGTLLAIDKVAVKDAFEQVAPKQSQYRIPAGDKQVLLVFTLPKSADPTKQYAVPVGYKQGSDYTFYTDDIFFYVDPHQLYSYWGPQIWQAIDSHQVILGMKERQVQLALGQVSKNATEDYGNRDVTYDNLGKPITVTFVKNQATAYHSDSAP